VWGVRAAASRAQCPISVAAPTAHGVFSDGLKRDKPGKGARHHREGSFHRAAAVLMEKASPWPPRRLRAASARRAGATRRPRAMASTSRSLRTGGSSWPLMEGPGSGSLPRNPPDLAKRSRMRRADRHRRRGGRGHSGVPSTFRPARIGEGGGGRPAARAARRGRREAACIGRGARGRSSRIARASRLPSLASENRGRAIKERAENAGEGLPRPCASGSGGARGAGRAFSGRAFETSLLALRATLEVRRALDQRINSLFKFKYEK
jgi:hypothetical protein